MADLMPSKGFLSNKIGPLPTWGWMGLGLGGALALSSWRKNKAQVAAANAPPPNGSIAGQPLPSNIVPQYTFVDESTANFNLPAPQVVIAAPPQGGRPYRQPVNAPPPPPLPPPPAPPPSPPPPVFRPPPPPPPPAGSWRQIIPWGRNQGPGTPSTLWGLAESVYGNGQGPQWVRIWNAPQNADLRNRRGDPKNIQPGDNFFVPA